jgi:uncharacterized protein YjiS (DUF1127 family)
MNWSDTISGFGARLVWGASFTDLLLRTPVRAAAAVGRYLMNLQAAHEDRLTLLGLDERMLKDIGVTRGQVHEMIHKQSRPWLAKRY